MKDVIGQGGKGRTSGNGTGMTNGIGQNVRGRTSGNGTGMTDGIGQGGKGMVKAVNGQATLRNATVEDAPAIAGIVNEHAKSGVMLQRPLSRIYDNIRDYMVVEADGEVIGCGALHVMWADLAEVRAVAVKEDAIGKGYGRMIVEALIRDAIALGIERVFALTYRVGFFEHLGFNEIDKSELPHKIWADCVNCMHFPNCDEVAMVKIVRRAEEMNV